MDARSILIAALDGPWPVLTSAGMNSLIDQFFQALVPINGVDAKKLVKAIGMIESSDGKNCHPRHEMAYCTGKYSSNAEVARMTQQFGHSAHCSYGPWQIMLINCPAGYTPTLLREADECARATSSFLVKQNVRFRPKSVAEWGQVWNGGHVGAKNPGVDAYVANLEKYYKIADI